VSFILALPEEFIIDQQGTSKAILRRSMRGIVPDAILDRKDKIGFATSEQLWLTSLRPWVEKTLRSHAAGAIPALNLQAVQAEWQAVLNGSKVFDFRVWRWLNLIRWAEFSKVMFE
jgi:asparagine synthase (glutamine-hydrolysing)